MAKKAKKRGVKPGTKRGPYKKVRAYKRATAVRTRIPSEEWKALNDAFMNATTEPASVGNLPSLISELQSSISQLEGQLTAQIDRIKSILV
jgi:uncharacterized alpha-E superfamily protein